MIDTNLILRQANPTLSQGLSSLGEGLGSYADQVRKSRLADLAMKQRQMEIQEAQRKSRQRDNFLADYQTLEMENALTPENLSSLYTQYYPEQAAQAQFKRSLTGSGQWVAVPGRPGWQMNKVTGEYRQSKDVTESLDPFKKSTIEDRKARLEEAKARRLQQKEIADQNFELERSKYANRLEEFKKSRGDKLFEKADKLAKFHYTRSQDFIKQRDAYDRVEASATDPTAAGDLALIFNYMKVLDPGSVVREGEFATAQSAGSVDDRTRGLYNRVLEGKRLSENQRKDFVNRSKKLFDKALKNQDKLDKSVKTKSRLFNIPVDLVFYDYRSASPEVKDNSITENYDDILDEIMGAD